MDISKGGTEVVWFKPNGMAVLQERWPDEADYILKLERRLVIRDR